MKILNIFLLIAVYILAYLSSATRYLGINMTDLNEIFLFQIMPPGVFFMIAWTSVYVLLGAFTILAFQKKEYSLILPWLALSHMFHIFWLITNGQQMFFLNVGILFLLWATLFKILDILKSQGLLKNINTAHLTFGAYYGWVTVALWTLGVSQVCFLLNPNFAVTDIWSWIAIGLSAVAVLLSWVRFRSIAALVFALWGMGGALLAFFR